MKTMNVPEKAQAIANRVSGNADAAEMVRNFLEARRMMYSPKPESRPEVNVPERYYPEPDLGDWEYPSSTGMLSGYPIPVGYGAPVSAGVPSVVSSLDPVKDAARRIMAVENSKGNPNGGWNAREGRWYPHKSYEGGADTIAYGIKLSNGTPEAELALKQGYLTDEQATHFVDTLAQKYYDAARKVYDGKYGEGEWDRLSPESQSFLTDFSYNPGLAKFPKLMEGFHSGDMGMIRENYLRYSNGKPLGRNKTMEEELDRFGNGVSIFRDGNSYETGGPKKPLFDPEKVANRVPGDGWFTGGTNGVSSAVMGYLLNDDSFVKNRLKDMKEAVDSGRMSKDQYDSLVAHEDAKRIYLGLPQLYGSFEPSPYRPTIGTSENPYQVNGLLTDREFDNTILPMYGAWKTGKDWGVYATQGRVKDLGRTAQLHNIPYLQNAGLSEGFDSKGQYLSLYDVWDYNTGIKNVSGDNVGRWVGGKPFDVYQRYYLDDWLDVPDDAKGNPYIAPAYIEADYASGGPIRIKPENRGKFTALKKRTGHSASWFKAHGTPAQKKMAVFALNSRHWGNRKDVGGENLIAEYPEGYNGELRQGKPFNAWDRYLANHPMAGHRLRKAKTLLLDVARIHPLTSFATDVYDSYAGPQDESDKITTPLGVVGRGGDIILNTVKQAGEIEPNMKKVFGHSAFGRLVSLPDFIDDSLKFVRDFAEPVTSFENGGYLLGHVYDLSEEQVNELMRQGYEVERV